jgi:hypothetical protein
MLTVDSLLRFVLFDPETREAVIPPTSPGRPSTRLVLVPTAGNAQLKRRHEHIHDATLRDQVYQVFENDVLVSLVPAGIKACGETFVSNLQAASGVVHIPFAIPEFGVTFLGTSHGFDPKGTTTGFVLWMNRTGIMVDPPPNSSLILEHMGIPPRTISGVILTHCHADHDAGTFQKLLCDHRCKIYTTQTIIDSFLRKYSAISGFTPAFLRQLCDFTPVKVGVPLHVASGSISFFYSLHVIPTVGFEARFEGESMVYSADTHTNPELADRLLAEGVVGAGRAAQLRAFPWNHTLVLHEAGVPPIHTPIKLLADLPPAVKSHLFVVHTAAAGVPADAGLMVAKEWETIIIPVEREGQNAFNEVCDLIGSVPALHPLEPITVLVTHTKGFYKKDTVIGEKDAPLDRMYVIAAGMGALQWQVSRFCSLARACRGVCERFMGSGLRRSHAGPARGLPVNSPNPPPPPPCAGWHVQGVSRARRAVR